jgi:hypothetical protein
MGYRGAFSLAAASAGIGQRRLGVRAESNRARGVVFLQGCIHLGFWIGYIVSKPVRAPGGSCGHRVCAGADLGKQARKGFTTTEVPLEFCLRQGEIAEAFDAWRRAHDYLGEELADIAIYVLSLAEMTGVELQNAVEASCPRMSSGSTCATNGPRSIVCQDEQQPSRHPSRPYLHHQAGCQQRNRPSPRRKTKSA